MCKLKLTLPFGLRVGLILTQKNYQLAVQSNCFNAQYARCDYAKGIRYEE